MGLKGFIFTWESVSNFQMKCFGGTARVYQKAEIAAGVVRLFFMTEVMLVSLKDGRVH